MFDSIRFISRKSTEIKFSKHEQRKEMVLVPLQQHIWNGWIASCLLACLFIFVASVIEQLKFTFKSHALLKQRILSTKIIKKIQNESEEQQKKKTTIDWLSNYRRERVKYTHTYSFLDSKYFICIERSNLYMKTTTVREEFWKVHLPHSKKRKKIAAVAWRGHPETKPWNRNFEKIKRERERNKDRNKFPIIHENGSRFEIRVQRIANSHFFVSNDS